MDRSRTAAIAGTVFASFLAHAGCSAAAPALRFTDGDGKTAIVPFKLRSNHIYVRGQVNESDSLWFFVDTGAGSNVINSSTAERLGLKSEAMGQALGAGGIVAATRLHGVTLKLRGLEFGDVLTAGIPLDPVATQTGQPVDGVVGAALFENAVVEIDYEKSLLTVHAPGSFKYAGPGKAVPINIRANHHPYTQASVTLTGQASVTGAFVLDTGSSSAVILSPPFVKSHHAVETLRHSLIGRSGGVGGASFNAVGRIDRLALGPYALEQPITTFALKVGGQISDSDAAGNIGGEVLRRFKVIFDYREKTMILEPAKSFAEPFETDMSGLVFHVVEDGSRAVDIAAVQKDSPAFAAGVATGDVVDTVDGSPLDAFGLADLRLRLRRPGETVHFGMRRGEVRSAVTLVTQRLL